MNHVTPYPHHDQLAAVLSRRNEAVRQGDVIVVPTDVLFFDGSNVVVTVAGGAHGERVTACDGGGVMVALNEAGVRLDEAAYGKLRRRAARAGLHLEEGVLRTDAVPLSDVEFAVLTLANGASRLAEAAIDLAKRLTRDRFRTQVEAELNRIFAEPSVERNARLQGHSTELLRFDYMVTLHGGRRLLLDAPVPDGSSVAAVFLRQLDMKAAHVDNLRQAVVYDDQENWPASSLAQLRLTDVPLISARHLAAGLAAAVG